MQGRSVAAAVAAIAAASLVLFALSESCEARHVHILSDMIPSDPAACMDLAVRIAEFNSSCPMQVRDIDCG